MAKRTVEITNTHVNVRMRTSDAGLLRHLDAETSYFVEGAQFTPAFREHRWDGREHLLRFHVPSDCYRAPVGLAERILDALKKYGYEVDIADLREVKESKPYPILETAKVLRDYQREAVDAIQHGRIPGIGMIRLPIRTGKTTVAAHVIAQVGGRWLCVVPSLLARDQMLETFEQTIDCKLGAIGEGVWDPGDVTVATAQSLIQHVVSPRKNVFNVVEPLKSLLAQMTGIIGDEAHHARSASTWRAPLIQCPAFYKIGLSATIDYDSKRAVSQGALWMLATFGPVRYEKTPGEMIDAGFLMQPDIIVVPIRHPAVHGQWGPEVRQAAVIEHPEFNADVVRRALDYALDGRSVLIPVGWVEHGKTIRNALLKRGGPIGFVHGTLPMVERHRQLDAFEAGDIPILIGTVFKEAIDIPRCDVLINAEGGESDIATVQRLRNLTVTPGKKQAIVVEYARLYNRYLAKHDLARIKLHRAQGFNLRVVE